MSIASSRTISGDTFYRNKPFDISFSIVNPAGVPDVSLYFSNSTYGPLAYVTGSNFTAPSGIPSTGSLGTLSVDVVTTDPTVVASLTDASYTGITGVAVDSSQNAYFTVANQNKVFVRDPAGTVTVFAGTGVAGDTNGDRLSAQFRAPLSISTDGSGTFYVTDFYRLRKIDPSGTVSTLAGGTVQGYVDSSGTAARFRYPVWSLPRPNGDVLVTDSDNHTIRNVTQTGVVTTYAGTGVAGYQEGSIGRYTFPGSTLGIGTYGRFETSTGTSWAFTNLNGGGSGIAFDGSTILYTGTFNDGALAKRQVDICSALVTTDVSLDSIRVAAYSDGTFMIGGSGSNAVIQTSTNQGVTWSTPTGTFPSVIVTGLAASNSIWAAIGIGANQSIYSTDAGATWTATPLALSSPGAIQYGGGLWVMGGFAESYPDSNIAYTTNPGSSWSYSTAFSASPGAFVTSLAYGNGLWVAAAGTSTAPPLQYSSDAITWTDCSITNTPYLITSLHYSSNLSRWFASFGDSLSTIATSTDGSNWTTTAFPNGFMNAMTDVSWSGFPSGSAQLNFPAGLAYDASGALYIADQLNHRIRRVASGATTTATYAGTGVFGSGDGPRLTTALGSPYGLARGSNGTLYVSSFQGHDIRTLTDTSLTAYAGSFGAPGFVNGSRALSRFNAPGAIAVGGTSLYVADFSNATLRGVLRYPEVRPGVPRSPSNGIIIATSNYPIVVNSRIDTCWTSVGGVLPLFKYEGFCNSFTANGAGTPVESDTLSYATSSVELLGYLSGTGTSNVLFRAPNGATTAYSYPLTLSVRAISNSVVVDDVSTSVTISPARLVYSPCNASISLYRNEPMSPVTLSILCNSAFLMYSTPTLPVGLSLSTRAASNAFFLSGTPTVQTVSNTYTIVGQDTSGRLYTTQLSLGVNPERLILDVSGSLAVSDVQSNVAIPPATITARFPPYGSPRSMTYVWSPPLPAGIQFFRSNGSAATSPAQMSSLDDASFGLTLAGTISESQLRSFAFANTTSYTVSVTGTRTSPLPSLSPSLPKQVTFRFKEVVLFDYSNVPQLLVGLPITTFWYSAKTYFPSVMDSSITSISVTDGFLPDGLAGTFDVPSQRFNLTGTPTNALPYSFTLTATNGMSTTASRPVSLTVLTDSVTITPVLADTCFNFIQYRSLANAKAGYYPSPIEYTARATSGCNVTIAGSNLPTGVSVAYDVSTGYYRLSGTPSTATGSSVATLRGTAAFTGVTADVSFRYSVSAEVFTFDPSGGTYAFQQNVPVPSSRITARTFSENPILRYSAPSLPPSVQLDNVGVLSGKPIGASGGSFDVTAFTAYSSGTNTYPYTMQPDVVVLDPTVYTTVTAPGGTVSIPINGYTRSATTVSNYAFTAPFPYGLTINPTTGLLSGTLAASLPASTTFTLRGEAGAATGTLTGTMTTDNLTTSRAQLIEIQTQSNLRVLYSDDIGSNWGPAASSNALVAGRIGVNNVDTYLIPTSSDIVLRSTTGSNYTGISLGQSAYTPLMTGVTNNPASSTWWIGGTISNVSRSVRVFKTADDGLTWDSGTPVAGFLDRSSNATPGAGVYDPYLYGGVDLAYRNGVLLLGGTGLSRSTDGGATWSTVTTGLLEVARLSLDQGTVWVAVGSSLYSSLSNNTYTSDATTIVYSTDQGVSWAPASGAFTMNAYEVVYGGGVWLASGLDWTGSAFVGRIRYSFDGVNWTILTSIPSYTYASTAAVRPPGVLGAIGYDQTDWRILRTPDDGTATLYSHPADVPIDAGWTTRDVTGEFPGITSASRFLSYSVQTIDPGADVTTITFPPPTGGPVFTSPAQSTYAVWQYMPIPAIPFVATGTAPISYVVSSLPVGLRWDTVRHTISGACMRTGLQSFTVYAIDGANNATAFFVTMSVDIPRIVKKQSSAGAYTALVRDYTEVAAAINARDTRVNPTEEAALGSFAAPYAPDVVTPSNCPC